MEMNENGCLDLFDRLVIQNSIKLADEVASGHWNSAMITIKFLEENISLKLKPEEGEF